jgi:hypothetical protein
VAGTFIMVFIVFTMYDYMVLKRNETMIANAAKSNAIVSSIVPDHLRDRLLHRQEEEKESRAKKGTLKTFLNTQHGPGDMERSRTTPLADLFLECTVCFADIVGKMEHCDWWKHCLMLVERALTIHVSHSHRPGFTAWSSARDPSQVFTLLETLYQSFDVIAKRRRVFKGQCIEGSDP